MCEPCNSNDIGELGHFDVLDEKDVRQAKLPTSTLANFFRYARTDVLSSYSAIH
jgi:hypothetical protein